MSDRAMPPVPVARQLETADQPEVGATDDQGTPRHEGQVVQRTRARDLAYRAAEAIEYLNLAIRLGNEQVLAQRIECGGDSPVWDGPLPARHQVGGQPMHFAARAGHGIGRAV